MSGKLKVKNSPRLIPIFIILLVVLLDQASKAVFFRDYSACNIGWAFGLGKGQMWMIIAVLILIFYWWLAIKNQLLIIFLGLVLAGGIGNLLDRLVVGCVRDFVKIWNFPSFNLADSAITIGVLGILSLVFRK